MPPAQTPKVAPFPLLEAPLGQVAQLHLGAPQIHANQSQPDQLEKFHLRRCQPLSPAEKAKVLQETELLQLGLIYSIALLVKLRAKLMILISLTSL